MLTVKIYYILLTKLVNNNITMWETEGIYIHIIYVYI